MAKTLAIAASLLLAASSSGATGLTATRPDAPVTLTVIHDSGRAVPLAPYLTYLAAGTSQQAVLPAFEFPIRATLQAGVLAQDDVSVFEARWLVQPIFIIGTDRASVLWLKHNREQLLAMNAWGVVIAAPDAASFKALQQFAQGMEIAPSQGPWLDRRLIEAGVNAYPVLIDTNGRARQVLRTEALPAQPGGRQP